MPQGVLGGGGGCPAAAPAAFHSRLGLMFPQILLLAICLVPREDVAVEYCASVNDNRFFDTEGRQVFRQAIFEENLEPIRYVRAWRMWKYEPPVYQRGYWHWAWMDGEVMRRVVSPIRIQSHTQYDPELHDRQFLHKEQRTDLRRIRFD